MSFSSYPIALLVFYLKGGEESTVFVEQTIIQSTTVVNETITNNVTIVIPPMIAFFFHFFPNYL